MIPLAIPNLCGNEGRYLQQCVADNFVSSVGPFVTRFEKMVGEATGGLDGVATSSGTTALHLGLVVAGVRPGDLVILPAFTFIASANAISHAGAQPWLLDITPRSWTIDPEQLERVLREETRQQNGQLIHIATGRRVAAIMPVYTLGMPPAMKRIRELAREFGIPVVADAAAALGARIGEENIAGLADISGISFNGNKTVTAGGGGMLVGVDKTLLDRARHLSTTARRGPDYDHDAVGYNYRMTNIQAAVGCAQMELLDQFVAAKRRIDATYRRAFEGRRGVGVFPLPSDVNSPCWFTGITLDPGNPLQVSQLCVKVRERGIEARAFWKPVHLQEPYREAPRAALPVAEGLWSRILTLPSSTSLTAEQQSHVIEVVQELLG